VGAEIDERPDYLRLQILIALEALKARSLYRGAARREASR
jgi:hypothetical protein